MGFERGKSNTSTIVSLVRYNVLVFTKEKLVQASSRAFLIILINGFFPACTICLLLRNSNAVEDHNRTIYVFSHN